MKQTTALLPDNVREKLNRRITTGLLPDPFRPGPNRPWALRVPQGRAYANPHETSASECSAGLFPPQNLKFEISNQILTYSDLFSPSRNKFLFAEAGRQGQGQPASNPPRARRSLTRPVAPEPRRA
jgi:hypothetical protein